MSNPYKPTYDVEADDEDHPETAKPKHRPAPQVSGKIALLVVLAAIAITLLLVGPLTWMWVTIAVSAVLMGDIVYGRR